MEQETFEETNTKSKFFAQYWGQNVLYFKHKVGTSPIDAVNICGKGVNDQVKEGFLKLKQLSEITYEDAKIIADNSNIILQESLPLEYKSTGRMSISELTINLEKRKKTNDWNYFQGQYLVSKGYAIPFMEYSVDDLISFGWLQLLKNK